MRDPDSRTSVRTNLRRVAMPDEAPISREGEMTFTRKSVLDHIQGVLSRWRPMLLTAVSVFGVTWTMSEAASYFLHADLSGVGRLLTVLVFSVIASVVWAVSSYISDAPQGFADESHAVRRIAQLQPKRWEALLARQLLRDALERYDEELQAARENRVFVPIEAKLTPEEYVDWSRRRMENLSRMLEVGTRLLVLDFMGAVMSVYSDHKPAQIRSVVYRIRDFYAATVQFELDRHRVQPPDGAERLHELQSDWSNPIREGVQQLYGILDRLIDLDLKKDSRLDLTITMDSPPHVDEYGAEISRLERDGVFG
jgi:hypothetical protein